METVEIPLTEAGWKWFGAGPPSQAEFQAALGNLVGIYIHTEWNTGADDTNVDNVVWPTGGATGVDGLTTADEKLTLIGRSNGRRATLTLTQPAAAHTRLVLYDVGGRERRVLRDAWTAAGHHAFDVDARLASGVYFARALVTVPNTVPAVRTARVTVVR